MRRPSLSKAPPAGSTRPIASLGAPRSIVSACSLVTVALLAWGASASAAGCPNEAIREQQGTTDLPGCRAYEMVSPPDKGGNDVSPVTNMTKSSMSGDRATWLSFGSFGDTQGTGVFSNYLSTRTSGGWTTDGISPPAEPAPIVPSGITGLMPDLSTAFVGSGTPLTPDAQPATINLYARDSSNGGYTLLSRSTNSVPFEPDPFGFHAPLFLAAAPQTGRVTFVSDANYLPGLEGTGKKIYASDGGQVSLVSILPNDEPAPYAGVAGLGTTVAVEHRISADGNRIPFTVPPEPSSFEELGGQLYLRDGSRTLHLTESRRTPGDPAGTQPAMFWAMSDDGSQVFFTSTEKLTDDSTACGEACPRSGGGRAYNEFTAELYRYDVETEELFDLTTHVGGGKVQGVLGISSNGSTVYFASTADLAAGASDGELNVFRWSHGNPIEFVATLTDGPPGVTNQENWDDLRTLPVARVSEDGLHLLFRSSGPLPGLYSGGQPQFYLFDARTGDVSCASCPPSGTASKGPGKITVTMEGVNSTGEYLPRALSPDGERVFFSSPDPLESRDTNGRYDAYVYDAATGSARLISTGRSETDSFFADSSNSGGDVFFLTRERLLPQDHDPNLDLYDARVNGGFPMAGDQGGDVCSGDECQGAVRLPPPAPGLGSAIVHDSGNVTRTAPRHHRCHQRKRGTAKRASRCGRVRHGNWKGKHDGTGGRCKRKRDRSKRRGHCGRARGKDRNGGARRTMAFAGKGAAG